MGQGSEIKPKVMDLTPAWARDYEKQQQGRWDATTQGPGYTGAMDYINKVIGGEYLDVDKNPYLRQRSDYLQREAGRRGDIEQAKLGAQFSALGPAFSFDQTRAQQGLERDLSQRTSGNIANMLSQNYAQERQMQSGAVGQQFQGMQIPLQGALSIINSSRGGKQMYTPQFEPSKFSQIASVAAPMAGSFAGAAMGNPAAASGAAGGMGGK